MAPQTIQATNFRYCSDKNYPIKLTGATVSLDPIPSGKFITFNLSARTDQTILGGEIQVDFWHYGKHFHSEKYNMCEGVPCPVSVGDFRLCFSQVLPEYVNQGDYSFKLQLFGEDRNQLTSAAFDFPIHYEFH